MYPSTWFWTSSIQCSLLPCQKFKKVRTHVTRPHLSCLSKRAIFFQESFLKEVRKPMWEGVLKCLRLLSLHCWPTTHKLKLQKMVILRIPSSSSVKKNKRVGGLCAFHSSIFVFFRFFSFFPFLFTDNNQVYSKRGNLGLPHLYNRGYSTINLTP